MAAAATHEGTASTGQPEGGLPQLNPEHFAGQVFWLVITFGLLLLLLSRVTLPKIASTLNQRKTHIEGDLASAERSKKDASDALAAYEAALSQARGRALTIADENRKRVVAEIEGLKHAADAEAQRAMGAAESRIAAERAKAEGNIRSAAAEAAAQIVERLLGVPVPAEEAAKAVDPGRPQRAT